MEDRFDALAKSVAGGLSRREALRRLGGGLAAMLLSAVGLNTAWGAPPSRPAKCSDYCNTLPTRQRSNCNNACRQCGGNTQNVCASLDSDKVACCPQGTCCTSGTCASLGTNQNCGSCGNACTNGTSCINGTCQCPNGGRICPGGTVCCDPGKACNGGSCVAAKTCSGDFCAAGSSTQCSATNAACFCHKTTEGANLCLEHVPPFNCADYTQCTSSADCPQGSFCASVAGCACGSGVCLPAGTCLT